MSLVAKIALHCTLLGFSTCVALGAAEVTVRVVLPQYISIQTDRAVWEHHDALGWIGRPDTDVFQGFDDAQKVAVRINASGFREDDVPLERTPGRTRILVLGDSVAYGFGARLEDRFSEVLERSLPGTELVNLGVSGYSTDQELLLYREVGATYRPDVVMLLFVSNDVGYNGRPHGHGHPKPVVHFEGDELVVSNVPVPETGWPLRVKYALQRNSALFNLARERLRSVAHETGLNRLAGDEALAGASEPTGATGADTPDPVVLTKRLFLHLRDRVEQDGARFLLVLSTTNADLESNAKVNELLGAWCEEIDLACVDTYPAFRAYAEKNPGAVLFLQDRSHWSALGHSVAARALIGDLSERGWLSPPTPGP